MKKRHAKLIIIGSGPAGYTAGIYAARAMLKPLLITGIQPGGQMTITTDVENYPGFADVIQGPWLMEQMRLQAEHVGTEIIHDHIEAVDLTREPFLLKGDGGTEYTADSVVIATGAQARWLDLPSEQKFKGFGVSACATCDGFFFRGKKVIVVGGGNTAVEEALYLANITDQVMLVHRRGVLRAEKILQERLFANPKIDVMWNTELAEVLGTENPLGVTGARLRSTLTRETFTIPDRRHLHRHRPRAANGDVQGPARDQSLRIHRHGAALDGDQHPWRVRRRRCHRRSLPAGGHRRRHGLHGGARRRTPSRRARRVERSRRIGARTPSGRCARSRR